MSAAIFPSTNAWCTPRSFDSRITSDNCSIILPQTIDKINRVLLNGNGFVVHVQYKVGQSASEGNFNLSELYLDDVGSLPLNTLDITKWIVEKAKYDSLRLVNKGLSLEEKKSVIKNNSWYYEHNSKSITLVNDLYGGFVFPVSVFSNIVAAGVLSLGTTYVKTKDGAGAEHMNEVVDVSVPSSQNLFSAQFRVYYTPLGESVKLDAVKTNPQLNRFAIPYSQQQPIVDSVTHGREMQSIANRTGCEKKEIVRTCHDLGELRHPRDGWGYIEKDAKGNPTGNIWRLTAAHFSIYCETYIIVKETWSKNWSYRSENVPINREFRSWNIPADIVQRNLRWQDYCFITRKEIELPDNSLLSDWAKRQILSLRYTEGDGLETECNNLWFYQVNAQGEKHGVALNCSAFGFGNSLVFSGKTKDNLSAGVQRVKSDDKDGNYQFCKDVYYCRPDGTLPNMCIQVGAVLDVAQSLPEVANESLYMYPEFKTVVNTGGGSAAFIPYNAPREGYNLFVENRDFQVLKDPSEQLNFTYQLHMMTDDGFLVIGSSWAANCPLVRRRNGTEITKTWKLTHYLPQGAQVMTSAYGVKTVGGISVSLANNTITFPPMTDEDAVGMCITDGNDNVLLALNSRDGATFKLHYTHAYKAIAEALN